MELVVLVFWLDHLVVQEREEEGRARDRGWLGLGWFRRGRVDHGLGLGFS